MGKQQSLWDARYDAPSKPRTVHTSLSHPLTVDWVPKTVVGLKGRLGMTFAPGKCHEKGVHGIHRRSMDGDLGKLVAAKTHTLVTLMESQELVDNAMGELYAELSKREIVWLHYPIRDLSIPTSLRVFREVVKSVSAQLTLGHNVVVHCRGGHGRTGLFVACVLVELDYAPGEAIRLVRAARKGTIHNEAQADFVYLYDDTIG